MTRLGAEGSVPVDFRLVCATHRDITAMVREGRFREDLYYRINVISIHIPPLRDRREDILWLADKLLSSALPNMVRSLSLDAQQAIYAHPWPGNVRQLEHVLRRAVALSDGSMLERSDLFPDETPPAQGVLVASKSWLLNDYLDNTERAFLVATLQETNGVVGEAALRLGISRKTLWEKMKRHCIDRQRFAEDSQAETT